MSDDILEIWKKFSKLISDEICSNPEFAKKMNDIFEHEVVQKDSKKRTRRAPAKIDPFKLIDAGEEKLWSELEKLDAEELKDIISENVMDSSKKTMRWKNEEKLRKYIVDETKRKLSHSNAFWNS